MGPVDVFLVFTERLEQARISYMATGSVASMLDVSGDVIDRATIQEWAQKLGLLAEWQKATAS